MYAQIYASARRLKISAGDDEPRVAFATVVSIRSKILKDKKLEKWERQFRNENPQYFEWNHKTADDLEAEAWLKEVWNKE